MLTRRRVLATLTLLAGALAPAIAWAPPALAHAVLVGSDPADGSRLATAPGQVTLRFSERVSLGVGFARVVDASGARVDAGPARAEGADGDAVVLPLRPGLGAGGYLVSYQVLSADSHPIGGAVTYAVGDAPLLDASGSVAGGTGTDGRLGAAVTAARWVSYAGLVLLGGAVFLLVCWPAGSADPGARRVLVAGGVLVAVAAVGTLLLQGPYAAGLGPGSVGSPDLVLATLGLPVGRLLLLRLAALAVLGVLLRQALAARAGGGTRTGAEDAAALAGFVLLFTHAAIGHAVSDPAPTAAVVADVAHLGAMAVWLGGLVLLGGRLLRSGPVAQARAALPAFSRLAVWSVGVLAVTGTYRALVAVGTPGALLGTTYGRLLLVKLAGVGVLLVLGAGGRRAVRRLRARRAPAPVPVPVVRAAPAGTAVALAGTPVALAAGPAAADTLAGREPLTRLRRSVLAELGVAAAVLAVTAALVGQPQARAVHPGEVTATVALGPTGSGGLVLAPARAGANTVRLRLTDPAGRPLEPAEVGLTAALPAGGLGPLRVPMDRVAAGSYRSEAVTLPRAGRWTLTVRVRTGEFDATVAQVTVEVR